MPELRKDAREEIINHRLYLTRKRLETEVLSEDEIEARLLRRLQELDQMTDEEHRAWYDKHHFADRYVIGGWWYEGKKRRNDG